MPSTLATPDSIVWSGTRTRTRVRAVFQEMQLDVALLMYPDSTVSLVHVLNAAVASGSERVEFTRAMAWATVSASLPNEIAAPSAPASAAF